ncbi:hypothetical protein NDU88_005232 [Pleurodeles waltl]|uniref:Uncharacterized protein n=1 Tax=Pleurodeles waltl TaxID=8319 RepID=A0AAV7WAH2_PLEWA|nr:hypothetical protein NDU88_005232 [Pleurodeles waltl]
MQLENCYFSVSIAESNQEKATIVQGAVPQEERPEVQACGTASTQEPETWEADSRALGSVLHPNPNAMRSPLSGDRYPVRELQLQEKGPGLRVTCTGMAWKRFRGVRQGPLVRGRQKAIGRPYNTIACRQGRRGATGGEAGGPGLWDHNRSGAGNVGH